MGQDWSHESKNKVRMRFKNLQHVVDTIMLNIFEHLKEVEPRNDDEGELEWTSEGSQRYPKDMTAYTRI